MAAKIVVITGGTRGIGKELVKVYLAKGAKVATFSSQAAHVAALVAEIGETPDLLVKSLDINDGEGCRAFIAETVARFGRIDTFYFNAGITRDKSFLKLTENDWRAVLETNLVAAFPITQAVFQQMSQQEGRQRMFFMTSLAGIEGNFGQSNYSASKAGLLGLSRTLALEGQKYGIQVNALSPAAETEMTLPVLTYLKAEAARKGEALPPLWQVGTAADLATTLYPFAETLAVSGQVFSLNGQRLGVYPPPQLTSLTKKEGVTKLV